MKTFFYILAFLIWLATFTLGCLAFAQVIKLSITQEVILGVLFVGSLFYIRVKKFQPSWMSKLD